MTRWNHLACAGLVVMLGLGVRFVDIGLPAPVVKYAGSILWGAMVWLLVSAVAPTAAPGMRLLVALAIAVAVECFRLYQTPEVDAFRRTLAGQLLLGRVFALPNIAAYAAGIIVAWLLMRRR